MRVYAYQDDDGYLRQVLLRDKDPDDSTLGIPLEPPDLSGLKLPEASRRDLHNTLVGRGLFTWADVVAQQNALTASAGMVARKHNLPNLSELRRSLIALYKQRR